MRRRRVRRRYIHRLYSRMKSKRRRERLKLRVLTKVCLLYAVPRKSQQSHQFRERLEINRHLKALLRLYKV